MSALQQVVCRGAIDPSFMQLLADSPGEALMGFDLADEEAATIMDARPQSLFELARVVEAWRRGEAAVARAVRTAWQRPSVALAG
jgi:hypothetical protein